MGREGGRRGIGKDGGMVGRKGRWRDGREEGRV